MSITIKEVRTRRDLRHFVRFPEKLYRDNPYYVPPLEFDQMETLDPVKGAAQEFCDSALYLAYKDGELVGRVAAIVNRLANEQWSHREVRFGWYDFVDDVAVSKALMDKVEEFGRSHGMESVVGPLGFTDFDPEGLLTEGYDKLSTMALIYNHPYYVSHIESMGFQKDAEWLEYKLSVPTCLPEKLSRVAKIMEHRSGLHVREINRKIIREEDYARKLFTLINECYKDLYNFTQMPPHMADKYLGFYLSILDLRFICSVENDKGEPIAFGITMPSIARALQKSRGRLWPFGWWHIARSLFFRHEEGIEMLLVGVHPDYQNSGVNALIFENLFSKFSSGAFKWAETNAILEENCKNQSQFRDFDKECAKRRRSYIKFINYK